MRARLLHVDRSDERAITPTSACRSPSPSAAGSSLCSSLPHDAADAWFAVTSGLFATCPITEGSLMRLLLRAGQSAQSGRAVIANVSGHPRHEFWPDDVSFSGVEVGGVIGPRQVTGAYLAQLVRSHHGRLATFDQGLSHRHSHVADLVPIQP